MDFEAHLRSFFSSAQVKDFIRRANAIPVSGKFPSLNYLGINFRGEEVHSIKLYYTFFAKPDLAVVRTILPDTGDLEKYYPYFEESETSDLQHTGCAFTIKMDNSGNFSRGFHFRFSVKDNPLFEPAVFVKLTGPDLENYQGISFEYSTGGTKKKRYYYITDSLTKKVIAGEWDNGSITGASLIEYTEAGNERKIIAWDDEISAAAKRVNIPFSETHNEFNLWMKNRLGLQNYFDGIYLGKEIKASYFYHFEKQTKTLFDFTVNRHIDTAGYIMKQLGL